MFQPTPPLGRALRRLALTTKQGPKDYYKGTGSGSTGRHTKGGKYIISYRKVRSYVPPDYDIEGLDQLTPFVSARIPRPARELLLDRNTGEQIKDQKTDGRLYLKRWKEKVQQREISRVEMDDGKRFKERKKDHGIVNLPQIYANARKSNPEQRPEPDQT
ncbi:hypothetical protein FKW77_003822 [Venturia effusa]|uniref:54S ribosomal protein L27, mitochondrial n=1 Tax=Venturia effusa TaxID=50376 RepID=A0A517LH00_9PEZI|nr:hypothetical protein FKW77_003822 [Venturia effusa]